MKIGGTLRLLREKFSVGCLSAVGVAIIIEPVFGDFVHGNPHRTRGNAIEMMLLFPPLIGFIAIIGTFLVFVRPQCFRAILTDVLVCRFNRRGLFGVLLALPLTAGLAWYSFDYLTPTDLNLGINTPRLLTTAACGSLGSVPDRRTRRALPHLSYSYAPPYRPAMLVTPPLPTCALHKVSRLTGLFGRATCVIGTAVRDPKRSLDLKTNWSMYGDTARSVLRGTPCARGRSGSHKGVGPLPRFSAPGKQLATTK
jgi:hypothetical protein